MIQLPRYFVRTYENTGFPGWPYVHGSFKVLPEGITQTCSLFDFSRLCLEQIPGLLRSSSITVSDRVTDSPRTHRWKGSGDDYLMATAQRQSSLAYVTLRPEAAFLTLEGTASVPLTPLDQPDEDTADACAMMPPFEHLALRLLYLPRPQGDAPPLERLILERLPLLSLTLDRSGYVDYVPDPLTDDRRIRATNARLEPLRRHGRSGHRDT